MKLTNKKSKIPVVNFFVKITDVQEEKFSDQEMRTRALQGLEQEYYHYKSINMVIFDTKTYEINFDTKKKEDYKNGEEKPPPKSMLRQISGYTRWISEASEIQWMQITKPGIDVLQYYVVTTVPSKLDSTKRIPVVKLISPV